MKVIYVAGPYSAENSWRREQNIRSAEALALTINKSGHAAICVHAASRYYFGEISEEHAIAADLEILRRCDAVLLSEGWARSRGTLGEIGFATAIGKDVFTRSDACLAWADGSISVPMQGTLAIETSGARAYVLACEVFGIKPWCPPDGWRIR